MFKSIIDDVKQNFSMGNMVTRLMIVNVAVFIVSALLIAFSRLYPFDTFIYKYFALSALPSVFLYKPWTFLTHMFLHTGLYHILWNMVGLNLFGRITGDLLGDRRILPLYIFGGLLSAAAYIASYHIFANVHGAIAMGASGSIMAIAMTAGLIAPDYIVRLLLIGDVKIKYIVFAFIFFDIIGTQATENTGGHFAHLGGALAGLLFIFLYKKGFDVLLPFERLFGFIAQSTEQKAPVKYRPRLKVEHRAESLVKRVSSHLQEDELPYQEKLDRILDKIKEKGYDKLTKEEKEFLKEASNKN